VDSFATYVSENWPQLLVTFVLGAVSAYLIRTHVARRQAAYSTLIDLLDAVDAAERRFHKPHMISVGGREHAFAQGLPEGWRQLERTGLLSLRLPRWRYRKIRAELGPLADICPTPEQGGLLHEFEDPHSPYAHSETAIDQAMPEDETLNRVLRGRAMVREVIRRPL
jgi:hypothetical protein